ncbi:MAG: cation diffusion facilitator family transporter [Thermodesulfobacteriota bacterium]
MTHHHHDSGTAQGKTLGSRLLMAMVINLLIPAAQITGGLVAGSMALISDAVHNLGDFAALVVAYAAHRAGRQGPSLRHSFGMQRLEILAAVINAALLGGAALYIAVEAMDRLIDPFPVNLNIVAWLALAGLLGNGLSAILLHRDSAHNLNARGAFLHMVGDTLTSAAVLAGALVMRVADLPWLDPALSLAIVVYIAWNAVLLLREAVHVLMNGTPRGLDLETVKEKMEAVEGVLGVHYLHAWTMGGGSVAMTGHVVVADQMVSDTERLSKTLVGLLSKSFGIDHPVLQFETHACGQGELLCQMTCANGSTCKHQEPSKNRGSSHEKI